MKLNKTEIADFVSDIPLIILFAFSLPKLILKQQTMDC